MYKTQNKTLYQAPPPPPPSFHPHTRTPHTQAKQHTNKNKMSILKNKKFVMAVYIEFYVTLIFLTEFFGQLVEKKKKVFLKNVRYYSALKLYQRLQ